MSEMWRYYRVFRSNRVDFTGFASQRVFGVPLDFGKSLMRCGTWRSGKEEGREVG